MIRLTLPLPPSKNNKYRTGSDGRPKLLAAVIAFRKEVWYAVKQARLRTIYGPCRITATYHPTSHRPDVHNFQEQLLDALQYARLIDNDRQVTDFHGRKGDICEPFGKVVLELTEIR